jgi:hypothetical protein
MESNASSVLLQYKKLVLYLYPFSFSLKLSATKKVLLPLTTQPSSHSLTVYHIRKAWKSEQPWQVLSQCITVPETQNSLRGWEW